MRTKSMTEALRAQRAMKEAARNEGVDPYDSHKAFAKAHTRVWKREVGGELQRRFKLRPFTMSDALAAWESDHD